MMWLFLTDFSPTVIALSSAVAGVDRYAEGDGSDEPCCGGGLRR